MIYIYIYIYNFASPVSHGRPTCRKARSRAGRRRCLALRRGQESRSCLPVAVPSEDDVNSHVCGSEPLSRACGSKSPARTCGSVPLVCSCGSEPLAGGCGSKSPARTCGSEPLALTGVNTFPTSGGSALLLVGSAHDVSLT